MGDAIYSGIIQYYGLDWLTMFIGLFGTYMITQQKRMGFLLNALACVTGLIVAGMSEQMGYIVYNSVILCMLSKAFIMWPRKETVQPALASS